MQVIMIEKLRKWVFSLQGKFIIVASTCIFIFTTVGSFLIISREESLYKRDIVNQGNVLSEISRLTLTNVMVYNELGMMDRLDLIDYLDYFIINLMERDKRIRYVAIFNDSGLVLASSDDSEYGKTHDIYTDECMNAALANLKTRIVDERFHNEPILKITVPLNIGTKCWGIIRINLSTKEVRESISSFKNEITKLVIFFSVISLLIISIGAKVLARPVSKLSKIMDSIKTHGDLEQQFPAVKDRRDEIGELQKSFLWMLQRLREADREHKKTIEVLSQTEKMVAIGRLAAGVAHEINNPLGGLFNCLQILKQKGGDPGFRAKYLSLINEGLDRIESTVSKLLWMARKNEHRPAPVNIRDVVSDVYSFVEYKIKKSRIQFINEADSGLMIFIDPHDFQQITLNLFINAIQAMEDGGSLKVRGYREDSKIKVEVSDTGSGIAQENIGKIFDPFFTTKPPGEGTGLGLWLTYEIIRNYNGEISVESEAGKGSTFAMSFPAGQ